MREFLRLSSYFLLQYGFFLLLLGLPAFLLFRWCLRRENRILRILILAAAVVCAAGCVFGVLRLTGTVILPEDNTYSYNMFDATWRDHGAALLLIYGGFLTAIIAAQVSAKQAQK